MATTGIAAAAGEQVEAAVPQVDSTVDCRGKLCPGPIIDAHMAMRTLQPGQVLELLATDPGAERDIPAFSRNTGHELLLTKSEGPVTKYYLRKKG